MSEETVRLIHSDRAGFCFRRPAVRGEVVKRWLNIGYIIYLRVATSNTIYLPIRS